MKHKGHQKRRRLEESRLLEASASATLSALPHPMALPHPTASPHLMALSASEKRKMKNPQGDNLRKALKDPQTGAVTVAALPKDTSSNWLHLTKSHSEGEVVEISFRRTIRW